MTKEKRNKTQPRTSAGTFASKGLGVSKKTVISVAFPQEVYDALQSLPNKSEYVRKIVEIQMRLDGLLP